MPLIFVPPSGPLAAGMTERRPTGTQRPVTPWKRIGGVTGLVRSTIPSIVFVAANQLLGLPAGLGCATGALIAVVIVGWTRRQPLRPALGGVIGMIVSTLVALRTGDPRDFFLPDVWLSLGSTIILAASLVVRWPLAGVVWHALNTTPSAWRRDPPSLHGYDLATGVLASTFAIRFVVQRWLYDHDQTGALAMAKIFLNYPLWALALIVVVWAVRRSDQRLAHGGPCH